MMEPDGGTLIQIVDIHKFHKVDFHKIVDSR
jgi:hypothetical protein